MKPDSGKAFQEMVLSLYKDMEPAGRVYVNPKKMKLDNDTRDMIVTFYKERAKGIRILGDFLQLHPTDPILSITKIAGSDGRKIRINILKEFDLKTDELLQRHMREYATKLGISQIDAEYS